MKFKLTRQVSNSSTWSAVYRSEVTVGRGWLDVRTTRQQQFRRGRVITGEHTLQLTEIVAVAQILLPMVAFPCCTSFKANPVGALGSCSAHARATFFFSQKRVPQPFSIKLSKSQLLTEIQEKRLGARHRRRDATSRQALAIADDHSPVAQPCCPCRLNNA